MAAVVYELWRSEDRGLLIMPGTLSLADARVVAEVTNYLEEAWTPVIATDVYEENALPLRLDNENPAQRTTTVVTTIRDHARVGKVVTVGDVHGDVRSSLAAGIRRRVDAKTTSAA